MRENLAGDYYLVSDITFPAPGEDGFPAEGFEPVGRDTEKDLGDTRDYFSVNYGAFQGQPFTGSFDGNGHTIRNFSIQRPDEDFIGLFGQISAESKITNVRMEDVDIRGKSFVGAIVGLNWGGSVSGVVVRGTLRGTEKPVQLIKKPPFPPEAGNAGGRFVGGLVGANTGTLTGSVQMEIFGANDRIGGLGGSNVNGTVKGHAAGTVEGGTSGSGRNGSNVGGLVGWNRGGTVIGYSNNTIRGRRSVGGLAGYSMGGNARIIGYSTGNITSQDPNRAQSEVGGLAGGSQGLVSGYATGEISGNGRYIGGLVGQASHKSRTTGIFRGTIQASRTGLDSALLVGLVTAISIPGPSVQGFHPETSKTNSKNLDLRPPFKFAIGGQNGAPIMLSGSIRAEDFTSVLGTNYGYDENGSKQHSNSEYSGFVFGSDVGQWTFHAGKWPSINLGSDPIFANTRQPIDP